MKVLIEKGGFLPARADKGSAGLDLICPTDFIVRAYARVVIPMAFRLELDHGYEAQIRPRSGCSLKGMPGLFLYDMDTISEMEDERERAMFIASREARFNADVELGTVDETYRGIVGVILHNNGIAFGIPRGSRIAQMVIAPVWMGDLGVADELSETERGEGGFNSTGTR